MIKCKKCGSANVKVDFGRVYTSIPAMYDYKCQDCGYTGYVNCSDVGMNNFTSDGFQNIQKSISQMVFQMLRIKKNQK